MTFLEFSIQITNAIIKRTTIKKSPNANIENLKITEICLIENIKAKKVKVADNNTYNDIFFSTRFTTNDFDQETLIISIIMLVKIKATNANALDSFSLCPVVNNP